MKDKDEKIVKKQETEEEENEIIPETDIDGGVLVDAKEKVEKLRSKLKEAEAKKQEYLDGWQRERADFVNLRKRDEEEKKNFIKFANERLVEEMIPVLDSFEMAFSNKEAWEKADKNWRTGIEYIYSQLKTILLGHGIKEVNPIGLIFDVARDEATEYVPVENKTDDHKIMEVIQRGYTLNDKLVRPAKVKVGNFKK